MERPRVDPVLFIDKVFNFGLREFQIEWLRETFSEQDGRRRYTRHLLGLPRGNGKALALDTPIPTPTGWTEMGALELGDEVFDDRGQPCRVIGATEVMHGHDCYRVTFADRTSIIADAGHLWRVRDVWRDERCRTEEVTLTTAELAQKHRIGRPSRHESRYRVPKAASLNLPDANLPVEPYVLGAWLGDGASADGRVTFGEAFIREEIERCGYRLGPDLALTRAVRPSVATTHTVYGLKVGLRRLGVLGRKHIPLSYLRASRRQRLQLLQGLMDTDGTISAGQGQCSLTSVSMRLAADVLELVRSLGLKATVRERRAKLRGHDCGPAWVVQFHAYDDTPVFRMPRKFARQRQRPKTRSISETRSIVSVTAVDSVPVRCIEVDSASSLFLASEGMVATHNSHLAAAVAGYMLLADKPRDGRAPQIVITAGSWNQAMITFKRLREFIEGSPLAEVVTVLSGRGFMRLKTGAELFVVSAEGPLQHGLEPTCVVFDEVWNQRKRELYEALIGGMIKRPEPLMVMISTAGYDEDSLLWELCKAGEAGDDPRLHYRWFAAPEDLPYDDPETWKLANPALREPDAFLAIDALKDNLRAMHEAEFRRWHLNQWTASDEAWINAELWDGCAGEPRLIPERETVIGVDASIRHDMTVVATVQRDKKGVYHAIFRGWGPEKEINIGMVMAYIRDQCREYKVTGVAYDPQYLHHAAQELEWENIPMVEWRQDNARMVPATRTLYEAVVARKLRHGGNKMARSHALAAGVAETERGLRLKKTEVTRGKYMDATVALAMAVDWASRTKRRSVYEDDYAAA